METNITDNITDNIINKINEYNNKHRDLFKGSLSVSKLCSVFLKEQFDEITVAERCALKGKTDPTYKYAGMEAYEILEQWHQKTETSKLYGRLLDEYTDLYFNNKTDELIKWKEQHDFLNDKRLYNNCKGVKQFYETLLKTTNYKYIGREIPCYIITPNNNKLNGRLDCLFYNEITNAYIIIDWKTTDDIKIKNDYHKHLLGPAYMFDDCDINIYTIQLQNYKKALVETYQLTSADKISIYVCNLLKESHTDVFYKLYKQNFNYDTNLLNTFIDYANTRNKIINMK